MRIDTDRGWSDTPSTTHGLDLAVDVTITSVASLLAGHARWNRT